jgi:Nuclease-related domain
MRKIKGSGSYLKNQTRKNLAKAFLCIILFGIIFFPLNLYLLFSRSLGTFEAAGLLISLAPLAGFYFYLRKYRIYNGGWQGEKSVAKQLSKTLSNDYFLINDVYLHDGGGDIDQIVLGPNGVFVLETKNWSGKIACNGDQWQRPGKHCFKGSPSRQVKRNAAKIRTIIDSSQLKSLGIWVEGIVVFTNNHSSLNINNPTVPILKLQQLPSYITADKTDNSYTSQQLEQIEKEILKQANAR